MRTSNHWVSTVGLIMALTAILTTIGVVGVVPASAHNVGSNGCTAVLDSGYGFDFHNACDRHDQCYLNKPYGIDSSGRTLCDRAFLSSTWSHCSQYPALSSRGSVCRAVSKTYYYGVRLLGGPFWDAGLMTPIA